MFEDRRGDGRFLVVANDLPAEPVDCIVNAANGRFRAVLRLPDGAVMDDVRRQCLE